MAEKKTKKEVKKEEFRYSRKNWILIFSGLLVGIISLIVMGLGDITISVILFVIAFLVLIPIGLLLKP
jgi:magnesium-transporting ATPase (P-type)